MVRRIQFFKTNESLHFERILDVLYMTLGMRHSRCILQMWYYACFSTLNTNQSLGYFILISH